jgi:hypothetical protein
VFGLFFGVVWAFSREGLTRRSNNPAEHSRMKTLRGLISSKKKHEEHLNHS